MNKKLLSGALVGMAIAFNASPLLAKDSGDRESPKIAFVCATQADVPTMYAYTPGKANLEQLMSWHSEYLLPEQSGKLTCLQTAAKLQASYEQEEAKYFKAGKIENKNSVCLVNSEDETCKSRDSETLFSVNSDYEASCVLDNLQPLECKALRTRGNIYSFENKPYQATWWPWW